MDCVDHWVGYIFAGAGYKVRHPIL